MKVKMIDLIKQFKTDQFIEKATLIFNDKYNYDKVIYIDAKTKVFIICKKHGEFRQRPNDHLSGKGCPGCAKNQKLGTEGFIERAILIFGTTYDYSLVEYKNKDTKVKIICKIHGIFEQRPGQHIHRKQGCPTCGKLKCKKAITKTTPQFIKEAILIHGNKFDYSLVEYKNSQIPITIICPIHGEFNQRPNDHLQGKGCEKCKGLITSKQEIQQLIDNPEIGNTNTILYFLNLYDENELFYKVGITTQRSVEARFSNNNEFPYNFKIIGTEEMTLVQAKKREIKYIEENSKYKYTPRKTFSGHTECFKFD